ncbi:MAG TPA: ABC transporter permease, partial [Candidatus Sulfotelmatobacter sp.]|nr:ABC transporter permease [Candidatus Sulfotelmatobacter sp.]
MLKFIVHRLMLLVPVLFIVTVLASLLIYFTPGDPVRVMLGLRANEEAVKAIRAELGLDRPLYVRYFRWLGNILRGHLGRSLQRNEDIGEMILARLPATLELTIFALCITALIAIPTGVISAVKANTPIDNLCSFFSLFWVAMPGFWIA